MDEIYKICIMGDQHTGKRSFGRKFSDLFGDAEKNYDSLGLAFYQKHLEIEIFKEKKSIKLQIWILDCDDKHRNARRAYLRKSDGLLLVFDLMERETLENLKEYYMDSIEIVGEVPIIVVGNKADLDFDPDIEEQAENFASKINAEFIMSSSEFGVSGAEILIELAILIVKNKHEQEILEDAIDS